MNTPQNHPAPRGEPLPHEPSPNQFGLRGMFLLMTALCLICAAISWTGIRQPIHLIGALGIVVFCVLTIGIIELFHRIYGEWTSPSYWMKPHSLQTPRLDNLRASDPPQNPFRGENPFRDQPEAGSDVSTKE